MKKPRGYWTKRDPALHTIWKAMIRRCHNQHTWAYRYYGARGIAVCERWREDFDAFAADIGPRPSSSHTLDRINNDGGYEPDNVRWATRAEQALNTRTVKRILWNGVMVPIAQVARAHGRPPKLIFDRVALGWDLEEALSRPVDWRRTRRASRSKPRSNSHE